MSASLDNPDLGAVVCRSRTLSLAATAKNQGFSWFYYYILLPLFFMPFLALLLAGFLTAILPGYSDKTPRWIDLGLMVFFYFLLFWFTYIFPLGDYCVL